MAKKKEIQEVDELETSGSEPRVYELGFHLDPELPTEEAKKVFQTIRSSITHKGAVIAEVTPEKIALAYTISRQEVAGRRDFDSAYFSWIAYEMSPTDHAEVLALVTANKMVVRFIDLTTTKDAARHALETHELAQKALPVASASTPEDALGADLDAVLEGVAA